MKHSERGEVQLKPLRTLACISLLTVLSLIWRGVDPVAMTEPNAPVSPDAYYQLLTNPGMEQAFISYGAQFQGAPCQVASGWTRFWDRTSPLTEPCWMDARVFAHDVMNTGWVEYVEGVTSQVVVSTDPYIAGIYQRVAGLTPGLPYGFHAAMMTIYQSSYGLPQDGHMVKEVGIDPTGGTNPDAGTIVWSEPQDRDYGWDLKRRTAVYAQADAVTVFIRVRSEDDPGDWPFVNQSFFDGAILAQTVAMAITSPEISLEEPFIVRWGAVDPGSADLRGYDVQWQDTLDGVWHAWLKWNDPGMNSQTTEASFTGELGHSYRFRVRAWQYYQDADNYLFSPWAETANVTRIVGPQLVGQVRGNGPYTFGGARVSIVGTGFETTSRSDGSYQMWTEPMAEPHAVTISNPPWLSPPPVYGVTFGPAETVTLDWTLRPPDDAVTNGGFEEDLSGWGIAFGEGAEPVQVANPIHTGEGAVRLGGLDGQSRAVGYPSGVQQTVTLTRSWDPNLSFWYLPESADGGDSFKVTLTVVPDTAAQFSLTFTPPLDVQGWQHQWYSFGMEDAYFTGTVTINFEVWNDGDESPTTVYLDEASVGRTPGGPFRAYLPQISK